MKPEEDRWLSVTGTLSCTAVVWKVSKGAFFRELNDAVREARMEEAALQIANANRRVREALLEAAGICDEEAKKWKAALTAHRDDVSTGHTINDIEYVCRCDARIDSCTSSAKRIRALAGGEETKPEKGICRHGSQTPSGYCLLCGWHVSAAPQPLTEARVREIVRMEIQKDVVDTTNNPLMRKLMVYQMISTARIAMIPDARIEPGEPLCSAALSSLTIRSEEKA